MTQTISRSFWNIHENDASQLINFIKTINSDAFCVVKSAKQDVVIPKGTTVPVPCRANTGGVTAAMPVLFEPDKEARWPTGLTVQETLTTVNKGKLAILDIQVSNNTMHNIVLPRRTLLGRLQLVRLVTEVDVKLQESVHQESGNKQKQESGKREDNQPTKSQKINDPQHKRGNSRTSEVELSDLTSEQQCIAKEMLSQEADAFTTDENDIGCIPELKMRINLKDKRPVEKNYIAIPRPLYPEVKHYLEDLLNKKFILKSKSPFFSSVVCVRKKDSGMRLCVDYRKINKDHSRPTSNPQNTRNTR